MKTTVRTLSLIFALGFALIAFAQFTSLISFGNLPATAMLGGCAARGYNMQG